jgi:hypothetical protein
VFGDAPCRAGEEVVGDWENVSRSRRIAEDCFRAELKREFWGGVSECDSNARTWTGSYHVGGGLEDWEGGGECAGLSRPVEIAVRYVSDSLGHYSSGCDLNYSRYSSDSKVLWFTPSQNGKLAQTDPHRLPTSCTCIVHSKTLCSRRVTENLLCICTVL